MKGKINSAPKGIYLTFRKSAGNIRLNVNNKVNVVIAPTKINVYCLLSSCFAFSIFRTSNVNPAIISVITVPTKITIPFATIVFEAEPSAATSATPEKTYGESVKSDTKITHGKRTSFKNFDAGFSISGNTYRK